MAKFLFKCSHKSFQIDHLNLTFLHSQVHGEEEGTGITSQRVGGKNLTQTGLSKAKPNRSTSWFLASQTLGPGGSPGPRQLRSLLSPEACQLDTHGFPKRPGEVARPRGPQVSPLLVSHRLTLFPKRK